MVGEIVRVAGAAALLLLCPTAPGGSPGASDNLDTSIIFLANISGFFSSILAKVVPPTPPATDPDDEGQSAKEQNYVRAVIK